MRWSAGRRALTAVGAALLLSGGGMYAVDASGRVPGGVFGDSAADGTPGGPTSGPSGQGGGAGGTGGAGSATAGPGSPPARPAPSLSRPTAAARPAAVTRRLAPLLADPVLGRRVGGVVLDLRTGTPLYARAGGTPMVPASLAKVLTAAAVLRTVPGDRRFATTVVVGNTPGEIVLVGGGDPALTTAADKATVATRRASLAALAARTAVALRGVTAGRTVRLAVDDSLFSGPSTSPHWQPGYVRSGVVAPVSALSADGGRRRAGLRQRERDPALAAGARFAALLRARGVPVAAAVTRGAAPPNAARLAVDVSPPVRTLVQGMLLSSNNDAAEILARHVAVATGGAPSFLGATTAIVRQVQSLGVPTGGLVLRDGSGLSRGSRMSAVTVARLLALAAASPAHPELRPVLTGLPVAGVTGTLEHRYRSPHTMAGAGRVRAKTGSLTGVTTLAGVAGSRDGLLVFALLADAVSPSAPVESRERLDRAAAALTGCGCR